MVLKSLSKTIVNTFNWELIIRISSLSKLSSLKCASEDAIIELCSVNKILKHLSNKSRIVSIYLYRRSSQRKFGELHATEILPAGKYTSDSHGRAGNLRNRNNSNDYYFSVFILFQRWFVSRRKLISGKYRKSTLGSLVGSGYWIPRDSWPQEDGRWIDIKTIQKGEIRDRNVIVDEDYFYACEGDLELTNWTSDVYTTCEAKVLIKNNSSSALGRTEIEDGVYVSSRKDQFFYHAFHWTLLKYLSLPPEFNGKTFIINNNLNTPIKNYIKKALARDFPGSVLIEHSRDEILRLEKLSFGILQSSSFVNAQAAQAKSLFCKILPEKPWDYSNVEDYSRKKVLVCKRLSEVILDRPTLQNWDEVCERLAKVFNVQVIDPAEYSLEEQAYFFANADYVIAEHGGSLSNVVFMKKGSTVIELQLSLSIDLYRDISFAHELRYMKIEVPLAFSKFELDSDVLLRAMDNSL